MIRMASVLSLAVALTGCGSTEAPTLRAAPTAAEVHSPEGHAAEGHAAEGHAPEGHAPEGHAAAHATGPQPTRVLDDGARLFGAEPQGLPSTALASIVANPAQFDGQPVRTEGTIERVCQAMGCWMELRAENAPAVRVPMAGHAFFLPRDVAGRSATIEGRVAVQALTEDVRRHLESEGALATASTLSIDATSVVIR